MMEMTGQQHLPVARGDAWQALNDPAVLQRCLPGCESVERVDDTHFTINIVASVGFVKARFTGKLVLTDVRPQEGYMLTFTGHGGAAGTSKGEAWMTLADDEAGTLLSYKVQAQVGGKLAQVGSRLVDGVARKVAETFFKRFTGEISPKKAA